jgi:hypothetical protein
LWTGYDLTSRASVWRCVQDGISSQTRAMPRSSSASTPRSVPNVNRSGRYCHSSNTRMLSRVPNVNRSGRYCHTSKTVVASTVVESQTSTARAGIVTLHVDHAQISAFASPTSTARAGIVGQVLSRHGVPRRSARSPRPKRQPLGQVLSRRCAWLRGEDPACPKRQPLGQVLSPCRGTRRPPWTEVPNVNRSGRYCHARATMQSARQSAWSQTSTARAGIVTLAIRAARRSRSRCPKRQPLGQVLSRSGRGCVARCLGVPNVNRSGRYCHFDSNKWSILSARCPKRQPLGQVLSPAAWSIHLLCTSRPKRQPLGQVLSRLGHSSPAWCQVPNVNRSGRYCHPFQL